MEIVDKIRAEIAQHMNEIERLNTALSVIESMSGKSFAAKPMITIRGVSSQPVTAKITAPEKPKRKSPTKRFGTGERQSTETIRAAVLELLGKSPKNAGELKRELPQELFATRGHNALSSMLHELKKNGLIAQQKPAETRYSPLADPVVIPPPSADETEAA